MFTWNNFDPANSKVARHSLLASATGTLLLGNITILSNEFSFFGLLVEVSQPQLVALGRVLCAVFLIVYLTKELPHFLTSLREWSKKRLETKQNNEKSDLIAFLGSGDDYPYDGSPQGEIQELNDTHQWENEKLEQNFNKFVTIARLLSTIITTYFLPVGLGLLAIFYPFSLNDLTNLVAH